MAWLERQEKELLLGEESNQGGKDDIEEVELEDLHILPRSPRHLTCGSFVPGRRKLLFGRGATRRPRTCLHRISLCVGVLVTLLASVVAVCGTFYPSYTTPPERYNILRQRVEASQASGSANINNEKVFIAASLYDAEGKLVSGHWGQAVQQLIHILGPENVFLSIYENDADEESRAALHQFEQDVVCNSSIVVSDLDVSELAHVVTPEGVWKLRRMAFLAEVRNRALDPLTNPGASAPQARFDRLLYINDVAFDPVDAANLLFSTHQDENSGLTQYRAACATDFINPIKFYDTFATRDSNGFDMGIPFYPWFTGAGDATSRNDVFAQKDAVRVKSCWGGMVAYEAKWFQPQLYDKVAPNSLRFRAENETFWEASECCLINADLSALEPESLDDGGSGIYMNPYIRVAYSTSTLRWLAFSRRFERLWTPVQIILNKIGRRPSFNARRTEKPGDEVFNRVWTWRTVPAAPAQGARDGELSHSMSGSLRDVSRTAKVGAFCGRRMMSYMDDNADNGQRKWRTISPPAERKT